MEDTFVSIFQTAGEKLTAEIIRQASGKTPEEITMSFWKAVNRSAKSFSVDEHITCTCFECMARRYPETT